MLKNSIVLGILLGLTGCAHLVDKQHYVYDRSTDYLSAQEAPVVAVPETLIGGSIGCDLPILTLPANTPGKVPANLLPPH